MTIISILQYPDPRLRLKARIVENVHDPVIQKIIDDMLETLANTDNCAALAATQLDIENPPSITVINREFENKEPLVLINPKILAKTGKQKSGEGCMSVYPDEINVPVERAKKVKVNALDREGNQLEFEAEDFLAKCLQHEIDHLNGMVLIDRISELKKQRIERKVEKIINKN